MGDLGATQGVVGHVVAVFRRRFRGPRAIVGAGFLVGMALVTSGCGGEERERYQVSGTVSYQGKPVEMGSIRFEADASVGNFAPVSHAPIKDGTYTTSREDSPTNGTYRVLVMGIDKARITQGPPGTAPEMPALFPPFQTTVQIPPPNGTFDVEIPSKLVAGKR